MGSCTRCGSFAINPSLHGRRDMCKPVGLCDVCYWRSLAEIAESRLAAANALLRKVYAYLDRFDPNSEVYDEVESHLQGADDEA